MTPEEWANCLDNQATTYQLYDTALALIGDEDQPAGTSQPVMILRAKHIESGLDVEFTYYVNKDEVAVLADTLTQMNLDMLENKQLNEVRRPSDDDMF